MLSRFARLTLASLRFLTLAGVLAMLLEPAIIFTKRETIPSRLLVLVDDSDRDHDGIPDFDDGFTGSAGSANANALFVPVQFELPAWADPTSKTDAMRPNQCRNIAMVFPAASGPGIRPSRTPRRTSESIASRSSFTVTKGGTRSSSCQFQTRDPTASEDPAVPSSHQRPSSFVTT